MDSEKSHRKTIFKDELNFIFEKYGTDQHVQDKLIEALFESPSKSIKQFLLKREININEQLNRTLNGIISDDNNLIGAISSLFIVQDDLRIPANLKQLFLRNENIGVFAGAGVSHSIGLPLWNDLANKAIEDLYNRHLINYFEYQTIVNEISDPKQKMTIYHELTPRPSEASKEFYEKIFKIDDKISSEENLYDFLVKFEWIKLTINIDSAFQTALDKMITKQSKALGNASQHMDQPVNTKRARQQYKDFDCSNMNIETVYQIHGTLDDLGSAILTTKDYLEAYYNNSNGLRSFLKDLFNKYTIVFIGVGLEEFPILEHIIQGSQQHYALTGTYLNEMNYLRLKREYLQNINITPIPYYMDFDGHKRIDYVLRSWLKEINESRSRSYYEKIGDLDKVL